MVSDAELVRRAQNRESGAFDALFDRHYARVFNFALNLTGDGDSAGDIAQSAFVKTYDALNRVRDGVKFCVVCGNVSDDDRCRICSDPRRDGTLVCVVEEPKDVQAVERTREFRGRYHVLGGALDPLSGVGQEQLRIRQLLNRIGERVDGVDITEVIIATDPNTEGEATATYLVRILRDIPGLTVTRIASGLPMGGDLEFADELTLGRALAGRRAMV